MVALCMPELLSYLSLASLYFFFITLASFFLYVSAFILSFLFFYLKESAFHSTNRPPVLGTIFHQLIHFNTLFDYFTNLSRTHKTFRFIKPSHSDIYTTDPANIEHFLKNNFSNYNRGDANYRIMKDLFGDGIFAVDGEKWKHQRKLASYEFSTKILRNFSSVVFRITAGKLANKIAEFAESEYSVVDLQSLFMKSTMDSIFKVGFGVEIDTLSGTDDFGAGFSKAFDESNQIVFSRFVDILWKAKRKFNIGSEAQLKRNLKVIDDFVFLLIQQKREQMNSREENKIKDDILSRFVLASQNDSAMDDRYLRDIILNFMIAGKDTSASTLTWFFYMLCKNPMVQETIVGQIREVFKIKNGCSIDEFVLGLTEEVLDRMHYLHAALAETLRLFPAVPMDGKFAEEDDELPDGFKVKKGEGIAYLSYAMGRMTYLWGEDAEDFRPERWLQNETFQPESSFKFIAFHAGPRICLGKDFAYRQMKILAATLLHFFKFKLENESMVAAYKTMFTLHMDNGLPVIPIPRLY